MFFIDIFNKKRTFTFSNSRHYVSVICETLTAYIAMTVDVIFIYLHVQTSKEQKFGSPLLRPAWSFFAFFFFHCVCNPTIFDNLRVKKSRYRLGVDGNFSITFCVGDGNSEDILSGRNQVGF